jgi:phage gp29-like protein
LAKKKRKQQPQQRNPQAPPLKRPDTSEIAVAQVTDKYSEYPSNGLTPVKLAEIFREADAGDVLRQMELFEEFEEKDPHLFSQLQTRKNAVTGLDYEIIPFDSDDDRDKEIAEFVAEQINSIENFEDVQTDLLDAIGKGFAVSEIIWGYDEGRVVIEDIRSRHQKRFFWDSIDDSFKVRTAEHPEGIMLPENKFILHRYKARSGHPSRAGVLRVVAWMYLFKNYDLKDWVSFAEIYGLPLRLGKYQPGASEDDKRALMQALIQIGADAAGIIPDGTSIEFITTEKTSSTDLYERLARYCDEQISKAVLGQTLTSDSGGGSYAQSKTHNEVRHDLTVADCKALAATLRRYLIRPLVLYNFGEDKRIPYLFLSVSR